MTRIELLDYFKIHFAALGKFGITPEAVFIVIFHTQGHATGRGMLQAGLNALDSPTHAAYHVMPACPLAVLSSGVRSAQSEGEIYRVCLPRELARPFAWIRVSKVRRKAEHRCTQARPL